MSTPDPQISKSAVFLAPDDFTVERVFPIRNLVGDADIPEVTPESLDSVSEVPACTSDHGQRLMSHLETEGGWHGVAV